MASIAAISTRYAGRKYRITFWVGVGMFSIFGSLAALAKDMG